MFPIYVKDEEFKEPEDPVYYLIAKNGIFLIKKTRYWSSSSPVSGVSFLQDHKKDLHLHLRKKVPLELLQQTINFFKRVYEKFHSEAIVLLMYNQETDEYKIVIPDQEVSGGGLHYTNPDSEDGFTRIGTIHSHGSMSAFHSGTDDEDEKFDDGFHTTVGTIDKVPELSCSCVVDGYRYKVELDRLFNMPSIEVPKEWLDKVKEQKFEADKKVYQNGAGFQPYQGIGKPSAVIVNASSGGPVQITNEEDEEPVRTKKPKRKGIPGWKRH